ncbi:MAG: hypothetical protein JSR58_08320 [Verrucomicrobia bacterium]|nr:hypothetical protein [Verrucomicrobiota bacterium]
MSGAYCAEKDREKAKLCAWAATIIYSLSLPFFALIFFVGMVALGDSKTPQLFAAVALIWFFCIPLSISVAFYLIWSRYVQGEYKKSRRFCLIPACTFIGGILYLFLLIRVYSSS